MDFNESFCVNFNSYNFYFLHGRQTTNTLQLYGKLKHGNTYNSCTIELSPIIKRIYVKEKPNTFKTGTLKDRIETALHNSINHLKTYSSQVVQRKTIYNNKLQEFLMIQYQLPEKFHFNNNQIPGDSCIEYISGLDEDVFEAFLLEKGIKCPCWLQIETYSNDVKVSCPSKLICHPNDISVMPENSQIEDIPLIKVYFLDIVNIQNENCSTPFAIAVGIVLWNGKTCIHQSTKIFALAESPHAENTNFNTGQLKNIPNLHLCTKSALIIEQLYTILAEENVNIIILHDKLKFTHYSNPYSPAIRNIFNHNIIMDIKQAAEEFYPNLLPQEQHLYEYFLNDTNYIKIPPAHSKQFNTANITKLMFDRMKKSVQLVNEMDVISTYMLISNVTGCPLKDVCIHGQLKRVECMLKHELHQIIIPETFMKPAKSGIMGGKIIKPNVGFFDNLIVMFDFKSLYPSVIREYNLSFTSGDGNVLPNLMHRLIRMREALLQKEQENGEKLKKKSTSKSNIVKSLTNSVYGCLCSEYSIFYHPKLANIITKHGRNLLTSIEHEIPPALEATVIFGLTDSIAIELYSTINYEDALKKAVKYQEYVNSRHNYIRLKLEGVFSHGIIFGKQEYALRYHNSSQNQPGNEDNWMIKGILRKTTPRISQELFRYFLERIVVKQPRFIRTNEFLTAMQTKFTSDDVNDYVVHIQLQNAPETYTTQTMYGNIIRRRNLQSCLGYSQHDTVSCLICDDGTDNAYNMRAYDLEEFQALGLRIDKNYYKEKQVLKLLEKILSAAPQYVNVDSVLTFLKPRALSDGVRALPARYRHDNILPFHFRCLKCSTHVVVNQRWSYECFVTCPNCHALFMDDAQADEICATVENTINEYRRLVSAAEKLTLVKGSLRKMAEDNVACMKVQSFKQMALWKEVILSVGFTLEWFAGNHIFDGDNDKIRLFTLFKRILLMLDEYFERDNNLQMKFVDFGKLYLCDDENKVA